MDKERAERAKRGETVPSGWPSYAVKYTHRESTEKGNGRAMVSVLREMTRRHDLFVPVDATKRPVAVCAPAMVEQAVEAERVQS